MLLVLQDRTADAKTYILNGFNEISADAIVHAPIPVFGRNSFPEVLSVAEEMARRGHSEESREILRVIESNQRSVDPDVLALKSKAGLISDNELRTLASGAMDQAEAADDPFRSAREAALSASMYALVGATKEVRRALVLTLKRLPSVPAEWRAQILVDVAKLMKYLDRDEIELFSRVTATTIADQGGLDIGDNILRAIAPLLAQYRSLLRGRRLAEQIVNVNKKLETYMALLDVYLSAIGSATIISDDKLPRRTLIGAP